MESWRVTDTESPRSHAARILGEFFGDDLHDGIPVRVRFRWTGISANTARWEQAFYADVGNTWETNWTMSFTRTAPP